MAAPQDRDPRREREADEVSRMGEGYFILGMAVQVGLVGLVGLALVGVQGMGFLTLGTAVALAGLAIGVLAIGSILTLASLRHTLNVVYDQDNRIDRLAQRLGSISEELGIGDEEVGWGTPEMEVAPPPRAREDPNERRPSPGPGPGPDPLEQASTYSPIEVPGIDAEATESLEEMDVEDTRELWEANPMYVAGRLEAEPDEVRRWQAMSRLMAIEGIDGPTAKRLSQAGVTTVEQLRHETPERLLRRLDATEAEAGQAEVSVDPQQAHDWIEAARAHAETAGSSPSETREA